MGIMKKVLKSKKLTHQNLPKKLQIDGKLILESTMIAKNFNNYFCQYWSKVSGANTNFRSNLTVLEKIIQI